MERHEHPLRRWGPISLIFLASLAVFAWKVKIAAPIQFLGMADPAGYATMAESLLEGRGFEVDYISTHFHRFPPEISHPEETWPPFNACLIAPFFAVMGPTALASKLPSMLIASFGFPLLIFLLARRVTRSQVVAFASALSTLLYEPLFGWSLGAMADISFGFLSICAVYFTVRGFDNSRWYYAMAAALALAWYTKGTAVVVIFAVVAYFLIRRLFKRPCPTWDISDRRFALSLALLLLFILPWFIRNAAQFSDPFFSSHGHVAGYVGWEPWKENFLAVYWDKEPPCLWDKFSDPARLMETSTRHFLYELRFLFLQMDSADANLEVIEPEPFSLAGFTTYGFGIPAALGCLLFLARRSRFSKAEYGLFLLLILSLAAFLSLVWVPVGRYNTPVIPLVMILGWGTIHALSRKYGHVLLTLILGIWSVLAVIELVDARQNRNYPWKDTSGAQIRVGRWISTHLEDPVIITPQPWGMHFYSGAKTVQLPTGTLEDVIRVARYYGATHLIPEQGRHELLPWLRGAVAGLRHVHQDQTVVIFEIDYRQLPELYMQDR